MKQTAVVFEAKIRSASSVIGLNNTTCADSMQGGKNRRHEEGEKGWKRERRGEKVGQAMKAACKEALRQGGCVSSVCGVSRLIFHAVVCWAQPRQSYSWPPFPGRELVARGPQAGFLLSLPVNCHQTSELLHDVSQRQTKSPIGIEPPTYVLPLSNSSVTARTANGDVSAKIQQLQYSKQLAAIFLHLFSDGFSTRACCFWFNK